MCYNYVETGIGAKSDKGIQGGTARGGPPILDEGGAARDGFIISDLGSSYNTYRALSACTFVTGGFIYHHFMIPSVLILTRKLSCHIPRVCGLSAFKCESDHICKFKQTNYEIILPS